MLKGWQRNTGAAEDVDLAETPVVELDDVTAAQRAFNTAVAEYESLAAEDRKYFKMLSPYAPTAVKVASVAYRDEMDALAEFSE